MTDIAIVGATGRMGRRLIALASEHDCRVVGAIVGAGNAMHGRDAGDVAGVGAIGVPLSDELRAAPQVLLDFSAPAGTRRWLDICRHKRIAMLIGTTGLEPSDQQAIIAAGGSIPVLQASNMSLGAAVLGRVARQAQDLVGGCDTEVVEMHHRSKKDAPSGTAVTLADGLSRGDQRKVPIHSVRIGDEIGRHTVLLALQGERLELTHIATSRDTFARGALRAAAWLAEQRPGRYAISHVLGL